MTCCTRMRIAIPCTMTLDALDEAFVFLWCPATFNNIGSHFGKPAFAAVLVCAVGDMLSNGMPFGRILVVGILCDAVSRSGG